jgi:hypothetical protein
MRALILGCSALQRRRRNQKRLGESGQSTLFVGMSLGLFVVFFAFVINIGMLVNAKINLQNAADLAAYAGASVQARQLNHIGWLNYEMRRALKKYLFRYYVIGNIAMEPFPRTDPGPPGGPPRWAPRLNASPEYKVPVVCIIFGERDNYCQNATQASIVIPPSNPLDAASEMLASTMRALESVRQESCKSVGDTNMLVLSHWLFNGVSSEQAPDGVTLNTRAKLRTISQLIKGVGLVPRELVLSMRIEQLEKTINQPPVTSVNLERALGWKEDEHADRHERTIQAFLSAYYSLGNHSFSNVRMDELLPEGEEPLLKLEPIKINFDAYSIEMCTENRARPGTCLPPSATAANQQTEATKCIAKVVSFKTGSEIPVGFKKKQSPTKMTYYAVQLKAKVRTLFSLFGDIEISAYSAARPFGSRIGPWENIDQDLFTIVREPDPSIRDPSHRPYKRIPNLPVLDSDRDTRQGKGFDNTQVLHHLYTLLSGSSQGRLDPNQIQINPQNLERAYQLAMAPNLWEVGKYNIPNDLDAAPGMAGISGDPFQKHFDSEEFLSFWAPVTSHCSSGTKNELQGRIDSIYQANATRSGNSQISTAESAKIGEMLKRSMNLYGEAIDRGEGEDSESCNVARIRNPFKVSVDGEQRPIGGVGVNQLLFTDEAEKIRAAWNDVMSVELQAKKRSGYSVKFVSFKSLTSGADSPFGVGAGAGFENRLPANDDITRIQH